MEFWYTEEHTPNVRFSIRVDRQLYSGQSEFQRIADEGAQHFVDTCATYKAQK